MSSINKINVGGTDYDVCKDELNQLNNDLTETQNVLSNVTSRIPRDITDDMDRLSAAIEEQNLEKYGYKIGDYFIGASGYVYWLADLDTYYGGYNSYAVVDKHHIGIVVDTKLTSAWHSTGTAVNYISSTLHTLLAGTVLAKIKTDIAALTGDAWSDHLIANDKLYPTVSGSTLTWAWGGNGTQNQYISAMTESQFYGGAIWSANTYQQGEGDRQLELFRKYKYNQIYGNISIWLRSLSSASYACYATSYGLASYATVSTATRASGLILYH